MRSRALSQLVNEGRVVLLDRSWVLALIAEMDGFGTLDWEEGRIHDDQVDSLNIALLAARGGDIFLKQGGWIQ